MRNQTNVDETTKSEEKKKNLIYIQKSLIQIKTREKKNT